MLLANEIFSVAVPSSVGILLPDVGVRLDDPSHTITANDTVLGPVFPTPLIRIQAVGSFLTWPRSKTLNPKPQTLHPKPQTLNPEP